MPPRLLPGLLLCVAVAVATAQNATTEDVTEDDYDYSSVDDGTSQLGARTPGISDGDDDYYDDDDATGDEPGSGDEANRVDGDEAAPGPYPGFFVGTRCFDEEKGAGTCQSDYGFEPRTGPDDPNAMRGGCASWSGGSRLPSGVRQPVSLFDDDQTFMEMGSTSCNYPTGFCCHDAPHKGGYELKALSTCNNDRTAEGFIASVEECAEAAEELGMARFFDFQGQFWGGGRGGRGGGPLNRRRDTGQMTADRMNRDGSGEFDIPAFLKVRITEGGRGMNDPRFHPAGCYFLPADADDRRGSIFFNPTGVYDVRRSTMQHRASNSSGPLGGLFGVHTRQSICRRQEKAKPKFALNHEGNCDYRTGGHIDNIEDCSKAGMELGLEQRCADTAPSDFCDSFPAAGEYDITRGLSDLGDIVGDPWAGEGFRGQGICGHDRTILNDFIRARRAAGPPFSANYSSLRDCCGCGGGVMTMVSKGSAVDRTNSRRRFLTEQWPRGCVYRNIPSSALGMLQWNPHGTDRRVLQPQAFGFFDTGTGPIGTGGPPHFYDGDTVVNVCKARKGPVCSNELVSGPEGSDWPPVDVCGFFEATFGVTQHNRFDEDHWDDLFVGFNDRFPGRFRRGGSALPKGPKGRGGNSFDICNVFDEIIDEDDGPFAMFDSFGGDISFQADCCMCGGGKTGGRKNAKNGMGKKSKNNRLQDLQGVAAANGVKFGASAVLLIAAAAGFAGFRKYLGRSVQAGAADESTVLLGDENVVLA